MMAITWDPINKGVDVVLSNNNLTAYVPHYNTTVRATEGKTKGKWYWEINVEATISAMIGVINELASVTSQNWSSQNARYFYTSGKKYPEAVDYGTPFVSGDIIGVAANVDNGTLEFYKNGV